MKLTIEQTIIGERVELIVTEESGKEVFRAGMNVAEYGKASNYEWASGGVAVTVYSLLKSAFDSAFQKQETK